MPRLQQLSPLPLTSEATAAARRALLLNPKLSEPHVALGMLLEYALEWERAESEFKTALALNSQDVEARVQYGAHLRIRGRLAEALKQVQLAREGDPVSAVVASHLSWSWFINGQVDSALAENARAWRIDSSNLTTISNGALVLLGAGQAEEARRRILRLGPASTAALYVLAVTGHRATVLERLQVIESTRPTPPRVHTARAWTMFGLGDTAQALDAFERAIDAKEMWFWGGLPSGPIFAGVRSSARFRALLRRVGLSQP
jgi:tetratricopeptide (TPR) repeat protein